ncbi:MAG: alpha/beta fold hydrolase [Burkholderiaceae bacterium]
MASFFADIAEGLFFSPDRRSYWSPSHFGLSAEAIQIPGPGGVMLGGLFLPAIGAAKGTVLHLHAGSTNLANHLAQISWLVPAGYNVLMFDYRGFGKSPGTATLTGILADAKAALAFLRKRKDVDANRIVVFGQTVGATAGLRLLAEDSAGIQLAVIESAWATHRGLMIDRYGPGIGHLTARLLPTEASEPIDALRTLKLPLVLVWPERESTVPYKQFEKLLAAAPEGRQVWRAAGKRHLNVFAYPGEWRERMLEVMTESLAA